MFRPRTAYSRWAANELDQLATGVYNITTQPAGGRPIRVRRCSLELLRSAGTARCIIYARATLPTAGPAILLAGQGFNDGVQTRIDVEWIPDVAAQALESGYTADPMPAFVLRTIPGRWLVPDEVTGAITFVVNFVAGAAAASNAYRNLRLELDEWLGSPDQLMDVQPRVVA